MLRMSENEFEQRLLWRVAVKKSGVTLTKIGPTKIDPSRVDPPKTEPTKIDVSTTRPSAPSLPMMSLPDASLETRLEQAVPIKEQLDAVRTRTWRGWRNPDFRRVYSAGKLLFQVVGVAGYAGYFMSMHTLMRVFSGALMAGAWYAIYRIKAAAQP